MKVIVNPARSEWEALLQRPYTDNSAVLSTVRDVLAGVKSRGDEALRELSAKFDGVAPDRFEVGREEAEGAIRELPEELKQAIARAAGNIEAFHKTQLAEAEVVETMPGIQCWRKSIAIEKVGLYIPGGTAPLFSTVLMLGIPARLAGCREIILCTPCNREGKVHPAVLYSAQLVGITRIFRVGGAQAVAAMAYGTATIPRVSKIFGPGNQYVTAAKQLVQMEGISIDMPAGPSEVCVLADDSADAAFVASDLLSQAEHGADSQVLLVSTSQKLVDEVQQELQAQLNELPRKEMAAKSLSNSRAIVVDGSTEAMELVNEYAAEHLIISCTNADELAEQVINAGSVFIGNYSPESAGDYASGTNHTLPTNGFARAYSGVSVDSFVKKITYQKLSPEGLRNIAQTVMVMAEAEGLRAHAEAVRRRVSREP
jgi:histidinol dehydrogenase